jgi:RND family efflux transporter MFP subunit
MMYKRGTRLVGGRNLRRLIFKILSVAIPLALGSCGNPPDEEKAVQPIAVRTVKPVVMDLGSRVSYMGTVHSEKEVKVIAQIQGTVAGLPVGEGDQVNAGDIVVTLDVPELRAVVERLESERDYWCRRYEADQRLVAANALPREQMESSQRACRSGRAAVAEAESRLEKATGRSPVNGEVLKWFVESGQSVMPGQAILLLGTHSLEIHVEVVEEDLQRGVVVGTTAAIETAAGERLTTAVSEVAPASSGSARTFTVKMPLPAEERPRLRTGVSATVIFVLQVRKNATAVPVDAIADRSGDPHIFLINGDRAVRQTVRLGAEQDGWIEVDFGWNGEDAVAITNLGMLMDSRPVFSVMVEGVRP